MSEEAVSERQDSQESEESQGRQYSQQDRVGIFVSHKAPDHEAARVIKQVLEDEDDRIDVHVFEGTPAGDAWEKWIREKLQASCILLLLYTDPTKEWDWCLYETGLFTPLDELDERKRRVICLYRS